MSNHLEVGGVTSVTGRLREEWTHPSSAWTQDKRRVETPVDDKNRGGWDPPTTDVCHENRRPYRWDGVSRRSGSRRLEDCGGDDWGEGNRKTPLVLGRGRTVRGRSGGTPRPDT